MLGCTDSKKCFAEHRCAWLVLMALLLLFATPFAAWSARNLGAEPAPDFVLKSLAGQNLRLSEYRGEVVMVNFWAVRCGRCRDQLEQLDALYWQHRERGVRLLSINIDKNVEATRDMVAALDLHSPVLVDTDKEVSRLYDLSELPMTLMIDHSGTVRL